MDGSVRQFWERIRRGFPAQWAAAPTNLLTDTNVLANPNILANASANLDGVCLNAAYGAAIVYEQINSVPPQIYIQSATGSQLDLIAEDYFGTLIQRTLGQSDTSFRTEIEASFFNVGPTISFMLNTLSRLGLEPSRILQQLPQYQAWDVSNWGWDAPTAIWCSRNHTGQVFIQMPPAPDASTQTVYNNALALTRPAGIRVWATTQAYGPPQPFGGQVIPTRNYSGGSNGAPYMMYSPYLKLLIGYEPQSPYGLAMQSSLSDVIVNPTPTAPVMMTMQSSLSDVIG